MHNKQYLPCSADWRIFSWALGCHPQTGEVKPCDHNPRKERCYPPSILLWIKRLFLVRNVWLCCCLIPTQTDVFIQIKHLNQISRCIFCTFMCVCSSLWAVSHGFKQDRPKVDGGKLVRKNDKWEVNNSRTPRESVWFLSSMSCGQFNWTMTFNCIE